MTTDDFRLAARQCQTIWDDWLRPESQHIHMVTLLEKAYLQGFERGYLKGSQDKYVEMTTKRSSDEAMKQ